jgi:glycosyltransferase involved in cell wall biosynthesis
MVSKPGGARTGIGRYVQMLDHSLCAMGGNITRVTPRVPTLPAASYSFIRNHGIDLHTFLTHYPIRARYPEAEIFHLTSQNLATLLLFQKPKGKVVVTVHDIIPYMVRHDLQMRTYHHRVDQLFDRIALAGLKRADHLIAVSQYTKQCVVEHLGISPEKITVVYPGIDHTRFRPRTVPVTIRHRYRLPPGRRYLIYVGSEDPRKNLFTLIQALANVRRELSNVELIKVGRAHFADERRRLIELATRLGVDSIIHFLEDVPDEDLPLLYNLADICVMPSLHEGFGFPPLEAMACGKPVVCTNAASLPEVSGDAGLLFEPGSHSADSLTAAILRILTHDDLKQDMQAKSLAHATSFRWSRTAQQMLAIYAIESS